MAKKYLLIEDVVKEIERLENSPYVALARRSEEVEHACRAFMGELQRLEEKGKALDESGVTMERLDILAECAFCE